ncbi:MAG: HD domain-containing protein [Patescibacteria group bacterium]|nr:HD domain-containing protein [Patescibacteria group bacterium]MCL5224309.1 HD domain-containing protein [Patescibacteria group bacterium]
MSNTFEHFLGRSLSHVVRFNGTPQHFTESVAEHSFYTVYFATTVLYFLKQAGEEVDEAKVMKMAAIHDVEEGFSGDIVNPFKHYNEQILDAIRSVNEQTIGSMFENLPAGLQEEYIVLWKEESAQRTKESQIVKLADRLSLISKCYEEMKVGNVFFKHIYEGEIKEMGQINYPWWQKIRDDIMPPTLGI